RFRGSRRGRGGHPGAGQGGGQAMGPQVHHDGASGLADHAVRRRGPRRRGFALTTGSRQARKHRQPRGDRDRIAGRPVGRSPEPGYHGCHRGGRRWHLDGPV
ncbi:uncharacterized protein METZ01_LOCUS243292, partial [marine metagenome]